MAYFWDTSALGAFIFEERFSPVVRDFNRTHKALRGYISFMSELELESVFQRKLNRGDLEGAERQDFRAVLRGLVSNTVRLHSEERIMEHAKRMITEYSLRSADALQLGTALLLRDHEDHVEFLCFDSRLNKAAKAEGMFVPFSSHSQD